MTPKLFTLRQIAARFHVSEAAIWYRLKARLASGELVEPLRIGRSYALTEEQVQQLIQPMQSPAKTGPKRKI